MKKEVGANEKQSNRQGTGSEYHNEHAGNVEGYGQPHTSAIEGRQMTKDKN